MTAFEQYYCTNTFHVSHLRAIHPAYLICDLTTSNTEFDWLETRTVIIFFTIYSTMLSITKTTASNGTIITK
jgi:hypothetical protein